MSGPQQQEDGQYPRLNVGLLATGKFVGKIVSLVGCIESWDGCMVQLACHDGVLAVDAKDFDFDLPTGTYAELVGFVNSDNSVSLFVTRELSPDTDMETYNLMIEKVQHSPKFSHYFTPGPTTIKPQY